MEAIIRKFIKMPTTFGEVYELKYNPKELLSNAEKTLRFSNRDILVGTLIGLGLAFAFIVYSVLFLDFIYTATEGFGVMLLGLVVGAWSGIQIRRRRLHETQLTMLLLKIEENTRKPGEDDTQS